MSEKEIKTKLCSKCKQNKSIDDFYKNLYASDGLQPFCKQCYKQLNRNYYLSHKERYKKYYNDVKTDPEKLKKRLEYRKKLIEMGYFKKYCKKSREEKKNAEIFKPKTETSM